MKRVLGSGNLSSNLWVIGEAPGETETEKGYPFAGVSGQKLKETLTLAGANVNDLYFDNVCQYQPPNHNIFATLPKDLVEKGKKDLTDLILIHKPKVILACGDVPLNFLTGKDGIQSWRGSILPCIFSPIHSKVVPCLHPAYVLRSPNDYPLFSFDISRALAEVSISGLNYLAREFILFPSGMELLEWGDRLKLSTKLAVDIESTYKTKEIICVGFAISPTLAVTLDWSSFEQRQLAIELLTNAGIEKVFHFGTFDTLMIAENGVEVNGYTHDTMVAQHILNPELPRSLDFLCSVYTREPYYKGDGRANIPLDTKVWTFSDKSTTREKVGIYNCKDVAITFEIHEQQIEELSISEETLRYYQDEVALLPVVNEISRNGMLIDNDMRTRMLRSQLVRWEKLQFALNSLYSYIMKKVDTINANSPKVICRTLYDDFKLPERKNYKTHKRTSGDDALVSLITHINTTIYKLKSQSHKTDWGLKLQFIQLLREIRSLRKLVSSYLANEISPDGRARGIFKVSSTDTGRWACEMYIDDTGFNLMTFPRGDIEVYDDSVITIEGSRTEDNPMGISKLPNEKELVAMFIEANEEDL